MPRRYLAWAGVAVALVLVAVALSPRLRARLDAPGPQQPVTITFKAPRDATGTTERLIQAFEADFPGVTVRYVPLPAGREEQRRTYAAELRGRRGATDVLALDYAWIPEFAENGWLEPLGDRVGHRIEGRDLGEFVPQLLEAARWRRVEFALPWLAEVGLLYARGDLLERAGFDPPTSWDELVRSARALMDQGDVPAGFVWPAERSEALVDAFLEFVWANGGNLWDEDGNVAVDRTPAVEALTLMRDLIRRHRITPEEALEWNREESQAAFGQGRAVFLRAGEEAWRDIAGEEGRLRAEQVQVVPIPGGRAGDWGTPVLGGMGLAINAHSPNKEAAWELARFMTGDAAQREIALGTGRLVARNAVYARGVAMERYPHYALAGQVIGLAERKPAHPAWARMSEAIQEHVHRVLTGDARPEESLAGLAARLRELKGAGGA